MLAVTRLVTVGAKPGTTGGTWCGKVRHHRRHLVWKTITPLPNNGFKITTSHWLMAGGGAAALLYVLPIFPETKKGLKEALRRDLYDDDPLGWNLAMGAFGFFGGFQGASAFISRIGSRHPVLAGFKTPWAMFGALLGGRLCYELTPLLLDASGVITRVVGYMSDGLIADTLGRPGNRRPAWEKDDFGGNGWTEDHNSTGSDPAAERVKEFLGQLDAPLSARPTPSIVPPDKGDEHLDPAANAALNNTPELPQLARNLVQLRRREAALCTARNAASGSDRALARKVQAAELDDIELEKLALKRIASERHGTKLSKFVSTEVDTAASLLTQIRLQQYSLGQELADGVGQKRSQIMREIKMLDQRKLRLKRQMAAEYSIKLARIARSVPKWREGSR